MGDSAVGAEGNLAVGEADKKYPAASAGECLWLRSTGFFVGHSLMSLYFLEKQAEGPPKSPAATGSVDLIPLDVPR